MFGYKTEFRSWRKVGSKQNQPSQVRKFGHPRTPRPSLTHTRPSGVKTEGSWYLCAHVHMCLSAPMLVCEQLCLSKCVYMYLCISVLCTFGYLLSMLPCTCMYMQGNMHMFLYAYLCIRVHACEIGNEFAFICAHLCPHGQECTHRCTCVSVCTHACVWI